MHAEAILGIAALSLVLTVFYGPWQETWTDWARQVVFECRDKIFDMAADGEIAFKSNEYRDIRESLHKLIRYSPHATFTSIFVRFIDENYGKKTS